MRRLILIFLLLHCVTGLRAHSDEKGADFIANDGQWDARVLYRTAVPAGGVFIEEDGISFSFYHPSDALALHDLQQASKEEQESFRLRGHAWKMQFIGHTTPAFSETGRKPNYYNYFTSQSTGAWTGNVPAFERVRYEGLYAGVDMELYHHEGNFKYDFIVAPQSDPSIISWAYEGLEGVQLTGGVLRLETSIGEFTESKPYAYQLIDGREQEVACDYSLIDGRLSFSLPDGYDGTRPLIIDPELIAATLSGTTGMLDNFGHCATYDRLGNIYTGCVAGGPEYPVTPGAFSQVYGGGQWDIGISKLTPDGSQLLWATYIGGEGADYPHSIIVNEDFEIYVYGSSRSTGYPTTASAYQSAANGESDIVVSHLSEDGSTMIGSTYLGGQENDGFNANAFNYGDAYRGEINFDNAENPVIVSHSSSDDFPTSSNAFQATKDGEQDAVVFGLDPTLSTLQFSTFLGGTYSDSGYGIRVNSEGDIYVAGGANEGLPTTAGAYQTEFSGSPFAFEAADGFVAKLNGSATTLLASTYIGTEGSDQAFFIDLDIEENVYVYGQNGADFPVVGGGFSIDNGRQFVSKFSPDLSDLLVSSTIGTTFVTTFVPDAFLVDICGNIYISAYYAQAQLPTTSDALFYFDQGEFYLAVFEPDMAGLYYGTYYTGNHVDGGTSRFDKNGVVYQAVCSCGPFNTTSNAWADSQTSNCDVGIFKIALDFLGVNAAIANTETVGCAPFEVAFENLSIGEVFEWDFGDGANSSQFEPTHTFDEPGIYTVQLIATDELSCNYADTTYLDIMVSSPQDPEPTFDLDVDCSTQSVEIGVTSGNLFFDYHWQMGDGVSFSTMDTVYQYDENGDYSILLTATALGCNTGTEFSEEVPVDIYIGPVVTAEMQIDDSEACGELVLEVENLSENATTYLWEFGDGTTSTEVTPDYTYSSPGEYDITLTVTNPAGCNTTDEDGMTVMVYPLQTLEADFSIVQTDCADLIVEGENESTGSGVIYSWDMGDGTVLTTEDVTHSYAEDGTYVVILTMTDTLCDINSVHTGSITAYPLAEAVMTVADQIGCEPFLVDLGTSSAGTASWDFGDGAPSEVGGNVQHLYPTPGLYTVTLTVEGPGDCSGIDVTSGTVEVVAYPTLLADFSFERIGECSDYIFDFENNSSGDIDLYSWHFGDGSESDLESPFYAYSTPGSYPVTLIVSHIICEVENELVQTVTMEPALVYELPSASFCPEESGTTLDAEISDATYMWSTGDTTQTIDVSHGGVFEVSVLIEDCWNTEKIEVTAVRELDLDEVVTQCKSENNRIVIPFEHASEYLWEDGTEGPVHDITDPGLYGFSIIDQYSCLHEGVIEAILTPQEPTVYIPNAFTPNADGLNDQFRVTTADLIEYEMRIYDRWGGLVFESYDPDRPWIGGTESEPEFYVPDGMYTYQLIHRGECTAEKIQTFGTITVVR